MPLNVAMEMRFTKHSDSPICPAYGVEVRNRPVISRAPNNAWITYHRVRHKVAVENEEPSEGLAQ